MKTYTHTLKAGFGFDVGQDFARAKADTPARLAPTEYAKPGRVIAYIPADPSASLGFLKYGNRDGEVRIHALSNAFSEGAPAQLAPVGWRSV